MSTYSSQPDDTTGVDAYISSDNATTNFGTSTLFQIGEWNGGTSVNRGILKFDLSSIPSNAVISDATLSLWVDGDLSSNARTAEMFRVRRNWVESQVTWNVWSTSNNWTTAGAGDTTNDIDSTVCGSCSFTASESAGTQKDFTLVVAELTKLIDGTYNNYGWLFKMQTETNDEYQMRSSSHATSANRPKLVINYTVPVGTKHLTLLGVS